MKQKGIKEVGSLRRFKLFENSKVTYLKFFTCYGWHFYFILTTWDIQVTKANVSVYVKE